MRRALHIFKYSLLLFVSILYTVYVHKSALQFISISVGLFCIFFIFLAIVAPDDDEERDQRKDMRKYDRKYAGKFPQEDDEDKPEK